MKRTSRIVLCFLLSTLLFSACKSVALTGRKQLLIFSDSQITSLSDQSYKEFLTTSKSSADKDKSQMIQNVGERMTRALESYLAKTDQSNYLKGLNWEYKLVASNEVNAFCMPSGKIVFYEGIMPYTNNEDFIAVVMGHEIAHALAKHGNERMSQEALTNTLGGLLQEVVGEAGGERNKALFNVAFGVGSKYGMLLPYSRKHEYEADRIGLIIMALAGYDITKAPLFWEKMSAGGGKSVPEFLSTHPSDQNRIENLKKSMEEAKSFVT